MHTACAGRGYVTEACWQSLLVFVYIMYLHFVYILHHIIMSKKEFAHCRTHATQNINSIKSDRKYVNVFDILHLAIEH